LVVRNKRVVRLHRERLKAPAILTALVNEQSGQWDEYRVATTRLTAASVRQVIARECKHCARRRASHTY
jgi:hypothetical protein